jgi:hypothetical protein
MTTPYTIPHTAQNISDAITQVVNADSTPQSPSQNMVTSEGVKAYVDGAVTGLTTNSFAAATLVEEQDAIASNDNDDTIPTSAAVKDYVDTTVASSGVFAAHYSDANGTGTSDGAFPVTEDVDTGNIGAVSNGVITVGAGLYQIIWQGSFQPSSTFENRGWDIKLRIDGSDKKVWDAGSYSGFKTFYHTEVFNFAGSTTVEMYGDSRSSYNLYFENLKITIIKLS